MATGVEIECEYCKRMRPDFAIVEGNCDVCLVEIDRRANEGKPVPVVPADIIARAKKLLAASDWTQMPDGRPGKAAQWAPYREALKVVIDSMEAGNPPDKVEWPTPPIKTQPA